MWVLPRTVLGSTQIDRYDKGELQIPQLPPLLPQHHSTLWRQLLISLVGSRDLAGGGQYLYRATFQNSMCYITEVHPLPWTISNISQRHLQVKNKKGNKEHEKLNFLTTIHLESYKCTHFNTLEEPESEGSFFVFPSKALCSANEEHTLAVLTKTLYFLYFFL